MLNAKANQFSLSPEGMILWQSKPENPLPGEPVARVVKGEHVLRPTIETINNDLTKDVEEDALKNALTLWLNTHIGTVLEPLVFLGIQEGSQEGNPVQAICRALYDSLGIVPREALEDEIAKLDTDQRAVVRSKKIKLGPILVFIPLLNKPAAVRLRALLWSIDRERPLPAPVPADGIVSIDIDEANADRDFFRAVGYPVYGGRAVRIDMLDRVINSIYDHAEKGKFSAKHQMAEWLGCSIERLYKILESMGHMKIYDPADDLAKQAEQQPVEGGTPVEAHAESAVTIEAETVPVPAEGAAPEKKSEIKPELAVFRLKRGKAFAIGGSGEKRRQSRHRPQSAHQDASEGGGQGQERGKKFGREEDRFSSAHKDRKGHRSQKEGSEGKRDRKDKKGRSGKDYRNEKSFDRRDNDREARVISFEVKRKDEDSPFAILQKLKAKADE